VNKVKILWIDHIYVDVAVYSTFPLRLIDSLRKNNVEVLLAIPSVKKKDGINSTLAIDTKFIPTVRLPLLSSISFFVMLLFWLPRAIKNFSPDAVIVDLYAFPGAVPALLCSKVKVIVDVRSSFVEKDGIFGRFGRLKHSLMIALAKHLCDRMTVTSNGLKEEMRDMYGINPEMVDVLTNGVSTDLFDYKKNEKISLDLRHELGVDKKFIVFYHGELGLQRGVLETAEAIAKLAHAYPDILFFLLGPDEEHLSEKLDKLIKNNVYVHKPVDHSEVPKFISMCDVGIAPFDTHSFPWTSCPLKVLEYLAMEKIVIATDILFNRELLKYGDCIFLIPSNSPENIAEAIEYVYKNREQLREMGKTGRSIIEQYYTWEIKAKDVVALIEGFYQK
jgi:glycosyltransferase involved in cell wall biosynthesis